MPACTVSGPTPVRVESVRLCRGDVSRTRPSWEQSASARLQLFRRKAYILLRFFFLFIFGYWDHPTLAHRNLENKEHDTMTIASTIDMISEFKQNTKNHESASNQYVLRPPHTGVHTCTPGASRDPAPSRSALSAPETPRSSATHFHPRDPASRHDLTHTPAPSTRHLRLIEASICDIDQVPRSRGAPLRPHRPARAGSGEVALEHTAH
jgi:hypothetical protein